MFKKNNLSEEVSLSKLVREIAKVIKNSPIFNDLYEKGYYVYYNGKNFINDGKNLLEDSRDISKLIPKTKYAIIVALSAIQGISRGLAIPFLEGKAVDAALPQNGGLSNPYVAVFGGLNHFVDFIENILANWSSNVSKNMIKEISTEIYLRACRNFMNSDAGARKKIGLPSFTTSATQATRAVTEFIYALSDLMNVTASVIGAGFNFIPHHPIIGSSIAVFSVFTTISSYKNLSKIQEVQSETMKTERTLMQTAQNYADNTDLFQRTGTLKEALEKIDLLLNENKSNEKKVNKQILIEDIKRNVAIFFARLAIFATTLLAAQENGDTIGTFNRTQGAVSIFFNRMMMLTRSFPRLKSAILQYREAMKILNTQPTIVDKDNAIDLSEKLKNEGKTVPTIEFENVSFIYPSNDKEKKQIFKNLNLKINPGEKIAIVGGSGNGKTTLVNLLERFYDVKEGYGNVKVDGVNVKDLKQESLRKNICYIPANTGNFFSGSIADNLKIINQSITDKDIEFALGCVCLNKFIPNIHDEDFVPSGGPKGSTGEVQRLDLARSFLSKAPVIIFDEPTSNFGGTDKSTILKSMKDTTKNKTAIVITHEADVALEFADRIVFIEGGNIAEDGRKEELLANQKSKFFKYFMDEKIKLMAEKKKGEFSH